MATKLSIKNSTQADGNMSFQWGDIAETLENRKKFLKKFDLHPKDCIVMELEHKDKIVSVNNSFKSEELKNFTIAEALITQEKGLVLFLMIADCLPIIFYDPVTETLALAHLGRRSTELKLSKKVIASMKETYQAKPENIQVFIGPCIHKESYIHTAPTQEYSDELRPFITELPNGNFSIDLIRCNIAQLIASGVQEREITVEPTDTALSPEYFSHYRSVRNGEKEGRFTTVAWLD